MSKMIETFRGEYNWLSNFAYFDKPMEYDNLTIKTNEHFFIICKTIIKEERQFISRHPNKGLKGAGKGVTLRDDWDNIHLDVMLYGLRYKFSKHNPRLRKKLIATKGSYIQEGNWWNDDYWGFCLKKEEGENHLGHLLMLVRDEILKGEGL